jgi:hypothetical protein
MMCRLVKIVLATDIDRLLVKQGEAEPLRVFGTELKAYGTFRQADFRDVAFADLSKFDHSQISSSITDLSVIPRQGISNYSFMMINDEKTQKTDYLGLRMYCLTSGAVQVIVKIDAPKGELTSNQKKIPSASLNSSQVWSKLFFCRAESEILLLLDILQSFKSQSEYFTVKLVSRTFGSMIANISKLTLNNSYSKSIATYSSGRIDMRLSLLDQILPRIFEETKRRLKSPVVTAPRSVNVGVRVLVYLTFLAMMAGCIIRIRYHFHKQEATRLSRLRLGYLRNHTAARVATPANNIDDSNSEIAGSTSKIDPQKYDALVSKRLLSTDLGPWNEAR